MPSVSDPFATLLTDTQLDCIAIFGISLYFFAYYALTHHWCRRNALWNRAARFVGLSCILLPLFLRWYLSASLLIAAGLMITVASVIALYIKRL